MCLWRLKSSSSLDDVSTFVFLVVVGLYIAPDKPSLGTSFAHVIFSGMIVLIIGASTRPYPL